MKNTKQPKEARPSKRNGASRCMKRMVGHSAVFVREGHDWSGCEVSVLKIEGDTYVVSRCCWIADVILQRYAIVPSPISTLRVKTWTCTEDELC